MAKGVPGADEQRRCTDTCCGNAHGCRLRVAAALRNQEVVGTSACGRQVCNGEGRLTRCDELAVALEQHEGRDAVHLQTQGRVRAARPTCVAYSGWTASQQPHTLYLVESLVLRSRSSNGNASQGISFP